MELGKLKPEQIRSNVILASLYIISFNLLESAVKEKTKDIITLAREGDEAEREYRNEITDKYPFNDKKGQKYSDDYRACALWLKDVGGITKEEVNTLIKIRKHRNDVVHQLPKLIIDDELSLDISLFNEIRRLLKKIMIFWTRVEVIDISDEYLDKDISDADIEPLNVVFIEYVVSTFINSASVQ